VLAAGTVGGYSRIIDYASAGPAGGVMAVRGKLLIGAGAAAALAAAVLAVTGVATLEQTPQPVEAELVRSVPAPAEAAATIALTCPFDVPAGRIVRCGSLVVPESWETPGGPPVTVFYAVTPADGDGPIRPDPVLVLNGGPGQSGSELIESAWERMAEVRRVRDILFVDQRGTGYSKPGLFCPALDPVAYWHGGLTPEDAERCRRPFVEQGYDLARFDTMESARDLVALRRALGIERWNLLGTSYGTVLALETVRQDAVGTRSVVLNSPNLTRSSWLDLGRMAAIEAVFKRLFEDCRRSPECGAAYPDLDKVFLELAERLAETPTADWCR